MGLPPQQQSYGRKRAGELCVSATYDLCRYKTVAWTGYVESSTAMALDITKTETFVPFLWIVSKTMLVVSLFSMFSKHALSWDRHSTTATAHNGTDSSTGIADDCRHVGALGPPQLLDVLDRMLAVVILLLVLCERSMDMYVVSRSDVTQKMARKTLTGLNTHIVSDIFVGFCLLHVVKSQSQVFVCAQAYGLTLSSCLWFGVGIAFFVYETRLNKKISLHDHDRANRYSPQQACSSSRADALRVVAPFLCYAAGVFLMSISITSPCLHAVYAGMAYSEYCLRLVLYAFYVCARCYTQGVPGDSCIDEIPNLVLFGWIVLIPRPLLYTSVFITVVVYTYLSDPPRRPSLLPVVGGHDTQVPSASAASASAASSSAAATAASMTSTSSLSQVLSRNHTRIHPPPPAHHGASPTPRDSSSNLAFMAQLQTMEQSIQGGKHRATHLARALF